MKTLLGIIQACQGELGLPISATVVGSTDATTVQMFYLANRVLDDLRREHAWTVLTTEFNLVVNPPLQTTATLTQNSRVVTNIPDTSTIQAQYFTVAANGVPVPSRVNSVDSTTQVTMTMEATGSIANTPITFSQDTYHLPTDLDWYHNQTFWDRTNRWALFGPDSPQMSQWLQSGIVPITPRRHFRQIGPFANRFRLWPPPAEIVNPLQMVFEYLSLNAVWVHGGALGDFSAVDFGPDFSIGNSTMFSQYFANDDDIPLLDDQSIILGIKYQFWQIKGFGFADMKNQWIDYVNRMKARDGSAPTLRMARRPTSILISPANTQDGNYPSGVSTAMGQ